MTEDPNSQHEVARAQRAHVRERLLYVDQLRELWLTVSDRDFERNYRSKYFPDYQITRLEALNLLARWEEDLIKLPEPTEDYPLQILWEIPTIQRLMWQHLVEFFVRPSPTTVPRPITAQPAPVEDWIVRRHFPGPSVMVALALHISLLFISVNPVTQHAFQKLQELNQEQSIRYYKLSEYLPEVISEESSQGLPKTAKRIPKHNQTIISNPPDTDNELQTIIQPGAPRAVDLAEIKLPNIISMKPQVVRPAEPPVPTLSPGVTNALDLPRDLLIPIPPALPPKADVGKRALSDIKIAESEVLNLQARLLLKPNAEVPDVKSLPPMGFGNTFADVPVPKGPDAVPTVTPEIGHFAKVDMPSLVVLSVDPAPPGKDIKVPYVSKAASFGTEEGNGNGGGGNGKPGSLNIPGITVQGGGLTDAGAAVVQTPKLPQQMASNIPPSGRTARTAKPESSPKKSPDLVLPKLRRFSVEENPQGGLPGQVPGPPAGPSVPHEKEKKIYTAYLNLANLSSRSGSWVMRFSEYDDPSLSASRTPAAPSEPEGELSAPRLVKSQHPRYPPSAMFDRVEGNVIVLAVIRKNGTVENVQVERSVDDRLAEAAVEALKHWVFFPSEKNGKPVDVLAEITIPFSLKRPE